MLTNAVLDSMSDELWMIAQSPALSPVEKERAFLSADELMEVMETPTDYRVAVYYRAESLLAELTVAIATRPVTV